MQDRARVGDLSVDERMGTRADKIGGMSGEVVEAHYRWQGQDSKKRASDGYTPRGANSTRILSLRDCWAFAAWVGLDPQSRRAASDRWNPEAINAMTATPRMPHPTNCDRASTHMHTDLR